MSVDAHFETIETEHAGPIVVEVPHAGLIINEAAARFTEIPREAVARNAVLADSDIGADRLWDGSEAQGICRVVALTSRYVIDLNTEPRLLTPYEEKMPQELRAFMQRSQCGFHWRAEAIPTTEVKRRIAEVLEPYHATVAMMLERARSRHGCALLISGHTFPDRTRKIADVVLGTRHGASASEELRESVARVARAHGFSVALEDPFAGGLSTVRHARRDQSVSVIQVEVQRRLLCREGTDLAIDPLGIERVREMLLDAAASAREAIFAASARVP